MMEEAPVGGGDGEVFDDESFCQKVASVFFSRRRVEKNAPQCETVTMDGGVKIQGWQQSLRQYRLIKGDLGGRLKVKTGIVLRRAAPRQEQRRRGLECRRSL